MIPCDRWFLGLIVVKPSLGIRAKVHLASALHPGSVPTCLSLHLKRTLSTAVGKIRLSVVSGESLYIPCHHTTGSIRPEERTRFYGTLLGSSQALASHWSSGLSPRSILTLEARQQALMLSDSTTCQGLSSPK